MESSNYRSFLPWENSPELLADGKLAPDDRSGAVYLYDPKLKMAAEIAIVVQRPLLLKGEPGCGKSSFAAFAARNLGWRYYEWTMTGRSDARDLLWRFDALSRLRDAQVGQAVDPHRYVSPGILWWAFNPEDAIHFPGTGNREGGNNKDPWEVINTDRDPHRAVVLIDEIDKAQPDVPNDLLEVFGMNRFTVDEVGHSVTRRKSPLPSRNEPPPGEILFVLTTNDERELPPAFVRRCITHTVTEPSILQEQISRLLAIASLHVPAAAQPPHFQQLAEAVARKSCALREQARKLRRRPPSTAEFLDALFVCLEMQISPDSPAWRQIEENVLLK